MALALSGRKREGSSKADQKKIGHTYVSSRVLLLGHLVLRHTAVYISYGIPDLHNRSGRSPRRLLGRYADDGLATIR